MLLIYLYRLLDSKLVCQLPMSPTSAVLTFQIWLIRSLLVVIHTVIPSLPLVPPLYWLRPRWKLEFSMSTSLRFHT